MKKFLFLCSMLVGYCINTYAQTFNVSPSTIASGGQVTVTGNGESQISYFAVFYSYYLSPNTTPVTTSGPTNVVYYNKSTLSPTTFKMSFVNPTSSPQTVSVWIRCAVNNDLTGSQNTTFQTAFTVTVNPAPPAVYYSAAYSKAFTRNNCTGGTVGSQVIYSVAANAYTSTVSQADADQKAVNYVNTNGQAYANANGSCNIVYYNAAASKVFTPQCSAGYTYTGPDVTYTVAANKYSSTVSQADADAKAQNDINTNGQTYANNNNTGTCAVPQVTITLQNSSSNGGTFQIQFTALTSTGANRSYNFTSGQTITLPAGRYDVGMRGPSGYTYKFSYYTCASSGTSPGPTAVFSNVNICANGSFMVIN